MNIYSIWRFVIFAQAKNMFGIRDPMIWNSRKNWETNKKSIEQSLETIAEKFLERISAKIHSNVALKLIKGIEKPHSVFSCG